MQWLAGKDQHTKFKQDLIAGGGSQWAGRAEEDFSTLADSFQKGAAPRVYDQNK